MKKATQNTKDAYHERLVPDELPWYNKQMYFDHLARYVFAQSYVKRKTVLDIACGSGYGCLLLVSAGAKKIIGIDNAKDAIIYAKKKYPHQKITYGVGDAGNIPLKNNSIDVVVSFETIEHVEDYKKFVQEIHRVLKKNGVVIMSTPNALLGTEEANPFHIKEFTREEFTGLLGKGFTKPVLYGQKPIHAGYLHYVNKITSSLPQGKTRWLFDSGFKVFFRGTKVLPIKRFLFGFTPAYFVAVAKKLD